jgi:signal transduction histidine kinase
MKLSTKIIAGFTSVLLLFIILFSINRVFSRYVEKDLKWVNNAEEALRVSSNLQKQIEKMQNNLRGYLLSNDEYYLSGYYQALGIFNDVWAKNQFLISNDERQWSRYRQFKDIIDNYRQNFADPLITSKRDAAKDKNKVAIFNDFYQNTFSKKLDNQLLSQLQDVFNDFDDSEYLIREEKEANLELSLYRIDTIAFILGLFVVIISIALMILITRQISTRINSMVAVAETIAKGNFGIQIKDESNDEMSRLSRSLNSMTLAIQANINKIEKSRKELESANKDLENFAYVASHDLKEPVRMISNYTQLISLQYADKLDATGKEYIRYAIQGSYKIRELINDLLSYVELTQSDLQLEQINLTDIAGTAKDSVIKSWHLRYDCIQIGKLPTLLVDMDKLFIVFRHLLDNAIKFSTSDHTPCVEVKVIEEKDFYLFGISDKGIGLDMAYKDKIFKIFQRLHNKDEFGGNGIGLTLSKKIIEMHGGNIWVSSRPGEGTIVNFTLPKVQNG